MRVKDPTEYNVYIQAIVDDLGIDEVSLHWRATLLKNVAGSAYRHNMSVKILKGMSKAETMKVLAHELRHIWQYKSGIFPKTGEWKGKVYDRTPIKRGKVPDTYYQQPWEDDAVKYATEAVNKFKHLVKGVK